MRRRGGGAVHDDPLTTVPRITVATRLPADVRCPVRGGLAGKERRITSVSTDGLTIGGGGKTHGKVRARRDLQKEKSG